MNIQDGGLRQPIEVVGTVYARRFRLEHRSPDRAVQRYHHGPLGRDGAFENCHSTGAAKATLVRRRLQQEARRLERKFKADGKTGSRAQMCVWRTVDNLLAKPSPVLFAG